MRTSNKILLGTLIFTILILTAVHIALFAQYKSGNIEVIKDFRRNQFEEHVLNNVHYILMNDVEEMTVTPSDTLSLSIRKSDEDRVNYRVVGDTLLIQLDSADKVAQERDYLPLSLRVPQTIPVEARNSSLKFRGGFDSATAISQTFILKQSALAVDADERYPSQYWSRLIIQASEHSNIRLSFLSFIDSAAVTLSNSNLLDDGATFEKLNLVADDESRVQLLLKNLRKLNLTPKQ